jgi:hypothetical protein
MDPAWIVAAVSLATVLAAIIGWVLRKVFRALRLLVRFTDDYFGEPASPGRAERPGVMTRLSRLEGVVKEISAQVHVNSGHSLRDVVSRTEDNVSDLKRSIDALKDQVTRLSGGKP